MSSEEARATYLENQMKNMSSVQLPLNIPSMEEESHISTDLTRRINTFCKERKKKAGTGISYTSIECIETK